MKTAKELLEISKKVNEDKLKKDDDNKNFAIVHFLKIFESHARNGKTDCRLGCLLKQKDQYFYQTDSGGEGFYIYNIMDVINELENLGFKIIMKEPKLGKTYTEFYSSWLDSK